MVSFPSKARCGRRSADGFGPCSLSAHRYTNRPCVTGRIKTSQLWAESIQPSQGGEHPAIPALLDPRKHHSINWIRRFFAWMIVRTVYASL